MVVSFFDGVYFDGVLLAAMCGLHHKGLSFVVLADSANLFVSIKKEEEDFISS